MSVCYLELQSLNLLAWFAFHSSWKRTPWEGLATRVDATRGLEGISSFNAFKNWDKLEQRNFKPPWNPRKRILRE